MLASTDLPTLDAAGLQARLGVVAEGVMWEVTTGDPLTIEVPVDIVVCAAASVDAVVRRHPDSAVIATVARHDNGHAVLGALQAGATTCIRGYERDLIAAFVVAVTRRRRLAG